MQELLPSQNNWYSEYLNKLSDDNLLNAFNNMSLRYLLSLDSSRRMFLLCQKKIQKRLFTSGSLYYNQSSLLNSLLNDMSFCDLTIFFTDETVNLIKESKYCDVIVQIILTCSNPYFEKLITVSPLTHLLIEKLDVVRSLIEPLPSATVVALFDYIISNKSNYLHLITYLNEYNQWQIIKHIGINAFYELIQKTDIFFKLADTVVTKLIMVEPFQSYFASLPIEDITYYIKSGLTVPNNLSTNKLFIHSLTTIANPNSYRFLTDTLVNHSYNTFRKRKKSFLNHCFDYYQEQGLPLELDDDERKYLDDELIYDGDFNDAFLEHEREKYYDQRVNVLAFNDDLLPEYAFYYHHPDMLSSFPSDENIHTQKELRDWLKNDQSKEKLYEILYRASTRRFHEILIDRYYKDIAYNFLINVRSLITFYAEYAKTHKLSSTLINRLQRYEKIVSFSDMSREEQVAFYHSFSAQVNYASLFYDDFIEARILAYDDMNQSVFKPCPTSPLYCKDESNRAGVDIYELNGEPFYAYIHVTSISRSEALSDTSLQDNFTDIFLRNPLDGLSCPVGSSISLTSDQKLETVRSVNKYVTFGYSYLNPKRVAHVYHADSYSIYFSNGIGTNKINEICTSSMLTERTRRYNEILYQEVSDVLFDPNVKYEPLKPDYLYCFDEVTDEDIALAIKLQIPILVVKTKYYSCKRDDYFDYNNDNEYIISEGKTKLVYEYKRDLLKE